MTGNQRWGQNAGDYIYLGLSVVGPKKLMAPAQAAQKALQASKALKTTRAVRALDLAETTNKSSRIRAFMGEYKNTGGHHVHAKKAFEGHVNYDPKKGFSISNEFMTKMGIEHKRVTAAQQKMFIELGKSGRPNTIKEHTKIAVESLIQGGASEGQARNIVAQSLWDLRNKGVTAPTNIPWFK